MIARDRSPCGPGFSTAVDALRLREWQLGPGRPTGVMDLFSAKDFHLIVDDRAGVHVSSRDGRFYLGWFPLGRPGTDGEGWKIAVTATSSNRPSPCSTSSNASPCDGNAEPNSTTPSSHWPAASSAGGA